ncbi:MAG TPA: SIR2 family protein [Burkholderiales bacterium]|nr:SIR2 family protein [Burkholderiales bacterium]
MAVRIAVLGGAGLTCDAGLPLSTGLAEKLKQELIERTQAHETDVELREKAGVLLATLRFLEGAVRFQEGVLNRDPGRSINIEQIAVSALQLRDRLTNPLAAYISGWHQRVIELETLNSSILSDFIEFIFSQLEKWLKIEDLKSIAYIARLADLHSKDVRLDVFSLNYDLCLEHALTTFGPHTFTNGFMEDGWRPSLFDPTTDVIRLFKLHGSLDWIEDELYGLCSLEFPRHRNAEDISDEHRPLLIFGTANKLSARQPFLSLAYHFSERILVTNVLVIIGYSFGDDYINEIVKQGLETNGKLRIVVVEPNASALLAAEATLGGNPRVTAIDATAKDALNEGRVLRTVQQLLKEAREENPF